MNIDKNCLISGPISLAKIFSKIDNMNDEEAYDLIRKYYKEFFTNAILDTAYDSLKQSTRFINLLIQVCIDYTLSYEERVYCNSMVYNEFIKFNDKKYIQKLYFILGMVVNRTVTNRIMNCGIDSILSIYLAVARKSSFDKNTNISRLNFCITCSDPNVMTIQIITDLYCELFNTKEDIKDLFLNIAKDTYVFNSDDEWITDDILTIAKNMNIAILSILDTLDLDYIELILMKYHDMITIENIDESDARISFKYLDKNQYRSISLILDKLASKDIFLP